MTRFKRAFKFGAVGVTISGLGSILAGCSQDDSLRAILLFIIMLVMGGGEEEATTTDQVSNNQPIASTQVIDPFTTAVDFTGDCNSLATNGNETISDVVFGTREVRNLVGNNAIVRTVIGSGLLTITNTSGIQAGLLCPGLNYPPTGPSSLTPLADFGSKNSFRYTASITGTGSCRIVIFDSSGSNGAITLLGLSGTETTTPINVVNINSVIVDKTDIRRIAIECSDLSAGAVLTLSPIELLP